MLKDMDMLKVVLEKLCTIAEEEPHLQKFNSETLINIDYKPNILLQQKECIPDNIYIVDPKPIWP